MPNPANDRNLLFGILAQQMDFISRDALVTAMHAWVQRKATPLGEILLEQQALGADTYPLLEALVRKHLELHDNDAGKSLAAAGRAEDAREDLGRIADADVQASLSNVTPAGPPAGVPEDTVTFRLGGPSSKGLRFRVLRPHAQGGLGQVSVALDGELHRQVALKELQDRHADNPESRARFLFEAQVTGSLEHPGIVPVYALGQYPDGRPYYAMRFIRGDTLKQAIDRFHQPGSALELRPLLGRLIAVCQAIQYAHDRGVLHRDLKPGNIMLGKYGETLVVDWGLARPLARPGGAAGEDTQVPPAVAGGAETLAGSVVGTPQYMSPEQAAGRLDQHSPASDVYSLGATLYYLLTGRPPVEGADVTEVLGRAQRGEFSRPREINPQVDRALEAVCLKAMALRPEDRYPSAHTLADDLERWLADKAVRAWPDPWTVRARRWVGRHRTLVTGAAAAALVGILSLSLATAVLAGANETIRRQNGDLTAANTTIRQQNEDIRKEVAEKEKQRALAEDRLDQSMDAVGLFARDARQYCEDALVPADSKRRLYAVLIDRLQELADDGAEFNVDRARARAWMCQLIGAAYAENYASVEVEGKDGKKSLHDGALVWYEKGLKLTDDWLAARPDDPQALAHRAGFLHLLGNHYLFWKMPTGRQYHREALEIRLRLRDNPEVDRFTPGRSLTTLADSYEALEEFDRALELREAVYERNKDNKKFVFDALDNWCRTLWAAYRHVQDKARRKEYLVKANELSARLATLRPTARRALERWADILGELGNREMGAGNLPEARKHYAKHAEITRKLVTSEDLLEGMRQYARSQYQLAEVEKARGKPDVARKHFEHSKHIREGLLRDYSNQANEPNLVLDLLFSRVALGEHAEAARLAEESRRRWILGGGLALYRLACVYAACFDAVREARGADELTPEDEKLRAE